MERDSYSSGRLACNWSGGLPMETRRKRFVKRARIVVMTADGHGVMAIMREAGVSKTTAWRWQEYFAEAGVEGLIKCISRDSI